MSDKEIDKIEPVEFDISQSPLFSEQPAPPASNKPSILVWVSLGVLIIVALAVIFVLPALVTEYELPLEKRVATQPTSPDGGVVQPAINAVSPFSEAQRSIQRKEAQDVLADLLLKQAELDDLQVEKWGQAAYNDAIAFAKLGDDAYLIQNFESARDNYQRGADALKKLQDSVPVVLQQHIVDGEAALAANDASVAQENFSIAVLLGPDNATARSGLARASTLDEVNALLADGDDARSVGNLEAARDIYRSAISLDNANAVARAQLEAVERQILENRFARVMSAGFTFLENNQPEQAIAEFQRAAALGINTDQANAAITQTRNEVARVEIERLQQNATTAESTEQWQQAVDAYNGVLEIDANLVFAINGKDYAQKRARLDQLLESAIASPERFAEPAVYDQTLDIYYTGRALENPGPRLGQQLERLQVLLENSQVPVTVRLQSDNQTAVQLLRVADLGMFEVHEIDLKPGRYVAVGTRTGYRDVRQEFVVGFGQTPSTVTVTCDEQVVVTRRR